MRTLFDITNALVSKLGWDELFSAISDQLSKVIRHDYAMLTLCNDTGGLDPYALHSTGPRIFDELKEPFDPRGHAGCRSARHRKTRGGARYGC